MAVSSTALIPITIGLAVLFIQKLLFLPLAIDVATGLYAIYSTPFYFFAYYERSVWTKLISQGLDPSDIKAVAAAFSLKPNFAKKSIEKAKKKGFFENVNVSPQKVHEEKKTAEE